MVIQQRCHSRPHLKKKNCTRTSVFEILVSGKSHDNKMGTYKKQRSLEVALQWIGVKECMHLRISSLYVYGNFFSGLKN